MRLFWTPKPCSFMGLKTDGQAPKVGVFRLNVGAGVVGPAVQLDAAVNACTHKCTEGVRALVPIWNHG